MLKVRVTQPNPTPSEYIIIGRFGRPYGVQGWIKVMTFTDPLENILSYPKWFIQQNQHWEVLALEDAKVHGQFIMAKIPGVDAPEVVKRYTSLEIAIPRDTLPALAADEIYLCDLPGFKVQNQAGIVLGNITTIFDSGAHDIIRIQQDNLTYLIPFIRDVFVQSIDSKQRIMYVNWDSNDTA